MPRHQPRSWGASMKHATIIIAIAIAAALIARGIMGALVALENISAVIQ